MATERQPTFRYLSRQHRKAVGGMNTKQKINVCWREGAREGKKAREQALQGKRKQKHMAMPLQTSLEVRCIGLILTLPKFHLTSFNLLVVY